MFHIRFLAASVSILLLAGCSSGGDSPPPVSGYAVGDEPLAVKAGVDVLADGGSAADAASAMYFMLSVTYPVAAGLGGGGLCIVHDQQTGRTEEFDFLARNAMGGGAYAVPGNVRGFATMQAIYGRLPWARDVAPGEAYAATGFPVSQALAARLASAQDVIRLDASLAAEFLDESGQVKKAGAIVSNPALAATLSQIRQYGASGFYRGNVAQQILAYSASQNGAMSADEFSGYKADRTVPQMAQVGGETAYVPSAGVGAGAFAGALINHLTNSDEENSATMVGEAVRTALDRFGIKTLPQDLGATGFAALDSSGQAVACAVTMNGPFGSGHTAQGTGIVLAHAPAADNTGLAAAFLTPVVATDGPDGPVTLAGAGAGGPNGTASIAYALVRLARGEDMTQPGSLRSTGMAPYDTVNAITCQGDTCAALPDPAAHGLGAAAGG